MKASGAGQLWRGAGGLLALLGVCLLGATPAMAGVGLAVTPSFPASVKVGMTNLPASLEIRWASNGGNATHATKVSAIAMNPSCGAFDVSQGALCGTPNAGVFTLSAAATGTGDCGGIVNFAIGAPDGNGKVDISPGFTVPINGSCTINFTIASVNSTPVNDAEPNLSGVQVAVLAGAAGADAVNGQTGGGSGSAEVSFPSLTTLPGVGGTLGPNGVPPVNLSDTATLLGLVPDGDNNPPTGTLTFSLFAPSDPTCVGVPFQTQTVDFTSCVFTNFTTTSANVAIADTTITVTSTAGFPASSLNAVIVDPVAGIANSITYTSKDATHFLGVTGVTDPFPAPSQVVIFGPDTLRTDCATSNTFTANAAGVWHWAAAYSGNVPTNQPLSSACNLEPVTVAPASPTIQTAPDPTVGTKLVTALTDQALLDNGFNPTGTITFTLFPPSNPTCQGAPIFSSTVPVNAGNNLYTSDTAPASLITETGTYNWVAVYSGDSNNNGATSGCGLENVVIDQPIIQIVKTPDTTGDVGGLITAGDTATFTITLTNNGPGTAVAVKIDDTLPGPLTWSFVSTTVGTCNPIVANVLHCDVGNLVQGASVVVVVTAPTTKELCVATPPNANAQFINALNGGSIGSASNAATVTDPGKIECQTPTIKINKTPDAPADVGGQITAGDTATFTITLTNNGPGTAKAVAINDALPGPLTWSFVSTSQGTCNPIVANQLTCNIGDVAQGVTVTVVVTAPVSLAQCTPAAGQAKVTFINATNGGAIGTATNAFQTTDPGQIDCVLPKPQINKTPDGGTINVGEKATFTIVVSNDATSPVAWKNVTVTDQLPPPLSGGSWVVITQPSTGTCVTPVPASNLLTCTGIGDLAPGASRTIVVQTANAVTAADANKKFLDNVAFAGAPSCPTPGAYGIGSNAGPVCNPGDITVNGVPHLVVAKTPDNGSYQLGDTITFTIVVTNDGTAPALNAHIPAPGDTLPNPNGTLVWSPVAQPTCSAGSGVGASCTVLGNTLNCSFNTLLAGGSCTVAVSSPTSAANPADCVAFPGLQNTACVAADGTNVPCDGANLSCEIITGCPALNSVFGFDPNTVDCAIFGGFDGGNVIVSEGATKIVGDVCIGPCPPGSVVSVGLKATIDGNLRIDPSCTVDLHKDLTITGATIIAPLSAQETDVHDACQQLGALPADKTFNSDIKSNVTITATHGGLNVVQVNGSINLVKVTLTLDAGAFPGASFLINVTKDLTCNGCTLQLNGGLKFSDVVFNVLGSGNDVEIFKPVAVWPATILACSRHCLQDHAKVFGNYFCGLGVKVHSAALICPQDPVLNP